MTQNAHSDRQMTLPDFRNLGVMLRILVIAEAANLLAFVAHAPEGFGALLTAANWGLLFETSALGVILVLFTLAPRLVQVPYQRGVWLVVGVTAAIALGFEIAMQTLLGGASIERGLKVAVLAALLAVLILGYFNWRQRVLSPALANARLMALQSRIRPHFLFNSLNTAISLVRQDPLLAEQVLLDMSDLFRALLADSRSLVPLADEIRLAEAYLQIEQLRLGERLRMHWDLAGAPLSAQVPILVLQPLLENAVRYGVEPIEQGGDVYVSIAVRSRELIIEVTNSVVGSALRVPSGNRIALANIEERLGLHFDAEGSLRVSTRGGAFVVKVCIPLPSSRSGDNAR